MKNNPQTTALPTIATAPHADLPAPTACFACILMGKKKKCCKKFERKNGKFCKSCPKR